MGVTQNKLAFSDVELSGFLSRHQLPPEFRAIAELHYFPLARRLAKIRGGKQQLLLGINGAQGTGKSTLADFLCAATESMFGWNVAILSIDDFYYTLAERLKLAEDVHHLLLTRGVPGTHDTSMLIRHLQELRELKSGEHIAIPRFDKAADDRADLSRWPVVRGLVDLVILEGWCVGAKAQTGSDLEQPVNALECKEDADCTWRNYVNDHLKRTYEPIFAQLDLLISILAPNFDAIFRWRLEQEEKLANAAPPVSTGLMNREQLARFLQFYERLTRANLETLQHDADIVFRLDDSHSIISQRE